MLLSAALGCALICSRPRVACVSPRRPRPAAYSDKFYRDVTGDKRIALVVFDWMETQKPIFGNATTADIKDWVKDPRAAAVLELIIKSLNTLFLIPRDVLAWALDVQVIAILDQLRGAMNVAIQFEGSWSLFIERMFAVADPSLHRKQAIVKDRNPASIPFAALHFQVANMTSYLTDGPVMSWMVDAEGKPSPTLTMPLQVGPATLPTRRAGHLAHK
jgi:hypothetical protein